MFDFATWVIMPIVGAIIGYSTNWIAVKMLFRPLTEKRLFGIRLPFTPGLIPKERYQLSKKVAETIGNSLLTEEAISEALSSEETIIALSHFIDNFVSKLESDTDTLEQKFSEFMFDKSDISLKSTSKYLPILLNKLSQQLNENLGLDNALRGVVVKLIEDNIGSLIGMFVNPNKIYDKIKKSFLEYIEDPQNNEKIYLQICSFFSEAMEDEIKEKIMSLQVCEITTRFISPNKEKLSELLIASIRPLAIKLSAGIAQTINVKNIVQRKMDEFAVDEAERIVLSIVSKELKLITLVGGVLGFIIGLVPGFIKI